jgi:hypothetical protein
LRSVSISDVEGDFAADVTAKALASINRLATSLSQRRRRRLGVRAVLFITVAVPVLILFNRWRQDDIGPEILVTHPAAIEKARPGSNIVRGTIVDSSSPCRVQVFGQDALVDGDKWESRVTVDQTTQVLAIRAVDSRGNESTYHQAITVEPVYERKLTLVGKNRTECDLDILGPGTLTIGVTAIIRHWKITLSGLGPLTTDAGFFLTGDPNAIFIPGELQGGGNVQLKIPVKDRIQLPQHILSFENQEDGANQVIKIHVHFEP